MHKMKEEGKLHVACMKTSEKNANSRIERETLREKEKKRKK